MNTYNIIDEFNMPLSKDGLTVQAFLYRRLQKVDRESLNENDRIRVILGDFDYYDHTGAGSKLTMIQMAINDLDFRNSLIEIVTTNKDIEKEIDYLIESVAYDANSRFSSQILEGEYTKRPKADMLSHYEYSNQIPTKVKLDDLSEKELHLLTKSKTFCMYPWTHMNASPNGEAMPCCLWDYNVKMGSVKEQSINELWNGKDWKKLRLDMLNEIPVEGCKKCYEEEQNGFFSNRQSANKHHGHHINKATGTREDGSIDTFQLTYWDIRFSNLCNLSCRSCGHIFSSSWYADQVKLAGPDWGKKHKTLFWAGRHETDMLEQLMEHIDYVEQIYFAGGEPLMMDEHYHILEELERRDKFHVRLVYNTNFTKTKLKDRYVFDYWRKFNSVSVGASLDAMGSRAEYIRNGTDWEDVEENRRRMMEMCPNVDFYVSPTLSILNAWHLPDFHREWSDKGLILPQDLNVNLLTDPDWLRIDMATPEYKHKLIEKYEKHLEWLKPKDKFNRATQGFESAITFMKAQDRTDLLAKFWEKTNKLDEIRGQSVLEVLPELNELT